MDREELKERVSELYEKYLKLVERRCQRLLGYTEAAEDAVQEVFVRVLKNYEQFRHESSPVTWLYQISTNVCIDELRRRARRRTEELTPEMQEILSAHQSSVEQRCGEKQSLERLVSQTDPTTLQILIHYHLDEMTQEEIASVLGLSRKTVWTRLTQVRKAEEQFA